MTPRSVRRAIATTTVTLLAGTALAVATGVTPAGAGPTPSFELSFLGRYNSGQASVDGDPGGAEISVFDPGSQRIFTTNGADEAVDIIDASDPLDPTLVTNVPTAHDLQSVAVHDGLVAVAVQGDTKTAAGTVQFFDVDGNAAGPSVTVGSLPDMLTFTADGTKVLVANEGEPDSYCAEGTDPEGSVSIVDVASRTAQTADFSAFNGQADALRAEGIRIYGPGASVAEDLEPEYVAISPDQQTAHVTLQENNALAIVDIASATVTDLVPLGYKDHRVEGQGLDPSDEDGPDDGPGVHIDEWPVFGMYQPDTIASFVSGGDTFYAMANEGDSREWECLDGEGTDDEETVRVKDFDLDEGIFGDDTDDDDQLGRLNVTRFFPAAFNGDDEFTSLYALGARSFSIRGAEGDLVWDSGDQFEQLTSTFESPAGDLRFNLDWNDEDGVPNEFDSRSDNKGLEPEALEVGRAYGRTFAFVGADRVGGIFLYDITDPEEPEFLQYLNTSDFTGNYIDGAATADGGDISPESLRFVPPEATPTGTPWLIGSYELSGTTAIFELEGPHLTLPKKVVVDERNRGIRTHAVEVTLDRPAPGPVTAVFVMSPKTATPAQDYINESGVVAFAPGETTARVAVRVIGDKRDEGRERFLIDLVTPGGALIDAGRTRFVIRDDD